MNSYTLGDGSGVDFVKAIGWGEGIGIPSPLNPQTPGTPFQGDGGFFGTVGDILSGVGDVVSRGYEALSQVELAKMQRQFAGSIGVAPSSPPPPVQTYSGGGSGFGLDTNTLMIAGLFAVGAVLVLRSK